MYLLTDDLESVLLAIGGKISVLPVEWPDGRALVSVGVVIDDFGNRVYPVRIEEIEQWVSLFGEENFITTEQLNVYTEELQAIAEALAKALAKAEAEALAEEGGDFV